MDDDALRLLLVLLVIAVLATVRRTRRRQRARVRRSQKRTRRHAAMQASAARTLDRLAGFANDGQVIAYLRRIDPFAFEEALLTAFERRGVYVRRNQRYTGDGGFDGEIQVDGGLVMIQAKRYSAAIDPAHVNDFGAACTERGVRGLFVHTGRTGPKSRGAAYASNEIEIISGGRLAALVSGKPVTVFGIEL